MRAATIEEMLVLMLIMGHEPPKAIVEGSRPDSGPEPVARGLEAAGSCHRLLFSSGEQSIVAEPGKL
jgi:hypothetical protein